MKAWPIRWRIAAALCLASAAVTLLIGVVVYLRFAAALDRGIDSDLHARTDLIAGNLAQTPRWALQTASTSLEADEKPAQVLRPDGRVLRSTTAAPGALLDTTRLRAALAAPLLVDRPGDARLDESLRLLATPVTVGGSPAVVVVGASLDERHETLSSLAAIGVVAEIAALLGCGVTGYLAAGVALRPVDAMRRRADLITDTPGLRLPVRRDDELGRLGDTLNAMLDRIERARAGERERLDRERRFVADASHELRTPLTVLKTEIEVALLTCRDTDGLRAALGSAAQETDRACRLVDDLLTLAATDALHHGDHPRTDLAARLREAVAQQQPGALRAGRRITVHAPDHLAVIADPRLLDRALSNLLDNALRHGAGDIVCTLTAPADQGVEGDRRQACLTVRDHGPGFPPAFIDHAFERFSQARPGRDGGGVGLGLAIVDSVARAHHGRAAAQTTPTGAVVRVWLPPAPGGTDLPPAPASPAPAAATGTGGPPGWPGRSGVDVRSGGEGGGEGTDELVQEVVQGPVERR